MSKLPEITMQSKRASFPQNGPNSSENIQEFSAAVIEDLAQLFKRSSELNCEQDFSAQIAHNEMRRIREKTLAQALISKEEEKNSSDITRTINLFSKENVSFLENTPDQNKLDLNPIYGTIKLPAIQDTPLFYNEDPSTGEIFLNQNLSVNVTAISEPASSGVGPQISPGDAKNAFNGNNRSYWVRKISYPLESSINSVSCSIEVEVPADAPEKQFNVLRIHAYPVGRVDITGIYYKPTATSDWILLDTFPTEVLPGSAIETPVIMENVEEREFIFEKRNINRLRVDLRQRNYVEEDNKKIFFYGAQEINASLVEFSTKNSTFTNNPIENNHIIFKVKSQDGTFFEDIKKLTLDPDPKGEFGFDKQANHVLYYIAKKPDISAPSNILWSSFDTSLPQFGDVIEINAKEFYVVVFMKFVSQIKVPTSPFLPNTTPVVKNIAFRYTIAQDEAEEVVVNQVDWTERNKKSHYDMVMTMDAYRAAAEDGSNMALMWDDWWNNAAYRTGKGANINGSKIDDDYMYLTNILSGDSDLGVWETKLITMATDHGGLWFPQKFRIQDAADRPTGSTISYELVWQNTDGVQPDESLISGTWFNNPFPAKNIINFKIRITLENNTNGDKPRLYNFALIYKD